MNLTRYLMGFLVLLAVAAAAWAVVERRSHEAADVRATTLLWQLAAKQRSLDSLQARQAEAARLAVAAEHIRQAETAKQTATTRYETIRRTPAATWPADSVARFLADY